MLFVEHEPAFGLRVVVLGKPVVPVADRPCKKCLDANSLERFLLEDAHRDSTRNAAAQDDGGFYSCFNATVGCTPAARRRPSPHTRTLARGYTIACGPRRPSSIHGYRRQSDHPQRVGAVSPRRDSRRVAGNQAWHLR